MKTELTKLLKIAHPIIQAPMAGADSPELVTACSNSGILGSLGAQYLTPAEIQSAIKEIRSNTHNPFAINLFALGELLTPSPQHIERAIARLMPYYERFEVLPPSIEEVLNPIGADQQLQVICKASVPVFSFTLGMLSEEWIKSFKAAGTVLIGTATNLEEAVALERAGVAAVCAQAAEAGGHRGTFMGDYKKSMTKLSLLVPQVVNAISIPVIAAGGIMDKAGIDDAMKLGASGVQMGTAFLTVEESPVHPLYKEAVCKNDPDTTTITLAFSGGAARGIENRYIRENIDSDLLPFPFHNALTKPFRKIANQRGEIEYTNLWCGQAGRKAQKLKVRDLVKQLFNG